MHRIMIVLVFCFCLGLVLNGMVSAEVVPPGDGLKLADAFFDVPWGAGLVQIDQAMTAQGVVLNQGDYVRYRGSFGGYPAYIGFNLWFNQYYNGTISGICQTRDEVGNGKVKECFSHLETILTERYGPPSQKNEWKGVRGYYWTKMPGQAQRDNIELMLLEHFAEGGLTEGSVQVRFSNRRLEGCLYSQLMGRLPAVNCPAN